MAITTAQLCPVCGGAGCFEVPRPWPWTPDIKMRECYGCFGKGWIVIR